MKGEFHVLEGATGAELNRRGVETCLSSWSASALTSDIGLNALRRIHLDYLTAGAGILTTNTFRTHRRLRARRNLSEAMPEFRPPNRPDL